MFSFFCSFSQPAQWSVGRWLLCLVIVCYQPLRRKIGLPSHCSPSSLAKCPFACAHLHIFMTFTVLLFWALQTVGWLSRLVIGVVLLCSFLSFCVGFLALGRSAWKKGREREISLSFCFLVNFPLFFCCPFQSQWCLFFHWNQTAFLHFADPQHLFVLSFAVNGIECYCCCCRCLL